MAAVAASQPPPPLAVAAAVAAQPLSPAREIAAGVFAGIVESCACHPVDQVKTQFHVNTQRNGSLLAELASQARTGGVSRLYRGLLAACLRPQALCMYTGNEWCKRLVTGGSGKLTATSATAAGFLTGYLEAACVCPFELVKVRMQVKEHTSRFASSASCARQLVATEGTRALLTRGLAATCARNSTFNATYFGLIFLAQQRLPRRESGLADTAQNLGLGAVAGVASCFLKAPFDVVKSRIQAELPASFDGGRPRYSTYSGGVMQALRHVAATEGPAALWKGLGPMCARMALGMSVSFAAFDAALAALGQPGGSREAAAAVEAAESTTHE